MLKSEVALNNQSFGWKEKKLFDVFFSYILPFPLTVSVLRFRVVPSLTMNTEQCFPDIIHGVRLSLTQNCSRPTIE
jgi:hypothetical protein